MSQTGTVELKQNSHPPNTHMLFFRVVYSKNVCVNLNFTDKSSIIPNADFQDKFLYWSFYRNLYGHMKQVVFYLKHLVSAKASGPASRDTSSLDRQTFRQTAAD